MSSSALDRLRAFQLGDERQIGRAGLAQRGARLAQVVGAQHEAHGHEIDAGPHAEGAGPPCPSSVRPDAGSGTPGALMPLCSPSTPPSTTMVRICWRSLRLDPQLDAPVVEQQRVARRRSDGRIRSWWRRGPGRRRSLPTAITRSSPGRAGSACDPAAARCGSSGPSGPAAAPRCGRPRPPRADARHHLAVRLVRPVREVQTEDVHAGGDQIAEGGFVLDAGPTVAMIFVRLIARLPRRPRARSAHAPHPWP